MRCTLDWNHTDHITALHGAGATDSVLAYTCAPKSASIDTVGVSLRRLEVILKGSMGWDGCKSFRRCTFLPCIG